MSSDPPPLRRDKMKAGMLVRIHPSYNTTGWAKEYKELSIKRVGANYVELEDLHKNHYQKFYIDVEGYGIDSGLPLLVLLDASCSSPSSHHGDHCPDCGEKGEHISLAIKCPKCWKVW